MYAYPLCKNGHREHVSYCDYCFRDLRKLEWRRMRYEVIRQQRESRAALREARRSCK